MAGKKTRNKTGEKNTRIKAPGKKKPSGKKKSPGKKSPGKKKLFRLSKKQERLLPLLMLILPLILIGIALLIIERPESGVETVSLSEKTETSDKEGEVEPKEGEAELEESEGGPKEAEPQEGETEPQESEGGPKEAETETEPKEEDAIAEEKKSLYLVIDDVGYETENLEKFLSLPFPVTYAVLPKLPETAISVEKIEADGASYILHQPMEPVGKENPGPGALYTKMQSKEVRKVLSENLKQLPHAEGINNHMGSKVTADKKVMEEVIGLVKKEGLFFLDSRTTADTVAGGLAQKFNTEFTERNVFLDNESSGEYIRSALEKAKSVAAEREYAVLIGHVWSDELPRVLREEYQELKEAGYRFRFLHELFDKEARSAGSRN